MSWKSILYDGKLDFSNFECDQPILNSYLLNDAADEHNKDITKLYLVIDDSSKVGGFYTINNGSISRDAQLPLGSGKRNYPYRQIGTAHIGRLARHKDIIKQSLGTKIMHMALTTASDISNISAVSIITVDAKDLRAENFYLEFDFKPLNQVEGATPYPKLMFLKIKDARAIIQTN